MRFKPSPRPTFLTAIMLIVLCGLGTWQLQRLGWKEQLIATIEARRNLPAVTAAAKVAECAATSLESCNYVPVTAQGQFKPDQQFRSPMIALRGEGGYALLSPFQLADGQWLLVNRGWIPYQAKPEDYPAPVGPMTINGLLRILPQSNWLTPANQPDTGVWYSYDLGAMAQRAGLPALLPLMLDADAAPNPGGYPLGGQTRLSITNNHLSYALTWYGLAGVLLVIFIVSSLGRGGRDQRLDRSCKDDTCGKKL